ncbi:MAG: diadenosine tetraphosphate hydrolase [Stappia sp.]|uniref:HIT domain-containing protein n=1 Tax=Stappia sp. TaxID=1870903 RepID=UPI000C64BA84|nr:HIT family protein [Stappia sp.]MAA99141.1 diadenosine tetraphosphate hydrolase [Stappia sp.]MBM19401.1 diadenosine tetraphosphate hydrolase [Stappia sp.]|tara:strand:+ start:598 stop:1023 length:426 start_codon:yes stop_codon:yes gene_type:complete
MATSVFKLDERLEGDSLPVCELPLCTVRLMRDARFPWLLLVPRCADASEIIDLEEADRETLMREIALASHALRDSLEVCDKINIGSLGNMVPQLHVHVIARVVGDAAWPGPVWGSGVAEPWARGKGEALARTLAARLKSPA